MTLKQFLTALKKKTKKTGVTWRLTRGDMIRATYKKHSVCPLWFLSELPEETDRSIRKLGLSGKTGIMIYEAADNSAIHDDLREQLLEAVGLREEGQ